MVFQLLALVTALTSAIGVTLIVKGMKSSKPVIAAFYSLTIQVIALTVIFFMSTHQLNLVAARFFSLGGILSLGIAQVLNFNAMRMLGASKTSAIIGSSPVIATVLSIIVLSESLNLAIFLGVATVTLGIVFISEATGFKIEKGLLSGLASAFAYALGNIINKFGILHQPDPLN